MKTKLVLLIAVLIIVELLFIYSTDVYRDNKIKRHLDSREFYLSKIYESSVNTSKNIANVIYNSIVNDKGIISTFAKANEADEKDKEEIRKKLTLLLDKSYEQQKQMGLKQLHFHLPDNTSFLRMHRKNTYGDNLTDIRFSVKRTNKILERVEGFEEGRIFNGYRFVFPLFYDMQHVGSMEIGISSLSLVNTMNKIYGGINDFIIKRSTVKSKVFRREMYNYSATTISEKYLRENISYEGLAAKNNVFNNIEEIFTVNRINYEDISKKIGSEKSFSIYKVIDKKPIVMTFHPVKNVENKHVGYIVNYSIDTKIHDIQNIYSTLSVAGIITIILIFGFIYQILANLEKSKLINNVLDDKVKEHQQQLQFKEQILFQQSKLATLGEMFSALAHQWKQPLNILAMYVQSMVDDVDEDELSEDERREKEELVERCMAQIRYMSETINDFMDFIKPAGNVVDKTELVKSVDEVIRLLSPSLENKNIKVSKSLENDTHGRIYAFGNPNEIRHILVNIINNAKDAINEIKENDRKFKGEIEINIASKDKKSIVQISDNGGGIKSSVINNIFQPYTTTKKGKSGSGLGLYMSKNIVEKYNGSMTVSNGTNGAIFKITFQEPVLKEIEVGD